MTVFGRGNMRFLKIGKNYTEFILPDGEKIHMWLSLSQIPQKGEQIVFEDYKEGGEPKGLFIVQNRRQYIDIDRKEKTGYYLFLSNS